MNKQHNFAIHENTKNTKDLIFKILYPLICCIAALTVLAADAIQTYAAPTFIEDEVDGQLVIVPTSVSTRKVYETDSWYSEVPKEIQTKGSVVDTIEFSDGSVNLYDSIPWDYAEGAYLFNVELAGQNVIDWIDYTAGVTSGLELKTNYARELPERSCVTSIDGVDVLRFAPAPAVISMDYCNGFDSEVTTWYTDPEVRDDCIGYVTMYKGDTNPMTSNRKYCVILEHRDTGEVYYLPLGASDCKGHTFPGGVLQTDIQLKKGVDDPTGYLYCNLGDTVNDYISITYLAQNASTFRTRPGREKSTVKDYFQNCLEIYGGSINDCNKLYKYDIKGYIVWPLGV